VIYLDLEAKKIGTRTEVMDRVAHIGDTVRRIFDEAESRGVTPLEAAEGLAAERLVAGENRHALAG
jgi:leucine dehydrogenase